MTSGITELVFAGLVLGFLYYSRNLWSSFFAAKAIELEIKNKDSEVELQPKIKAVKDKQEAMIAKHGKWLTLDDLNQISTKVNK